MKLTIKSITKAIKLVINDIKISDDHKEFVHGKGSVSITNFSFPFLFDIYASVNGFITVTVIPDKTCNYNQYNIEELNKRNLISGVFNYDNNKITLTYLDEHLEDDKEVEIFIKTIVKEIESLTNIN